MESQITTNINVILAGEDGSSRAYMGERQVLHLPGRGWGMPWAVIQALNLMCLWDTIRQVSHLLTLSPPVIPVSIQPPTAFFKIWLLVYLDGSTGPRRKDTGCSLFVTVLYLTLRKMPEKRSPWTLSSMSSHSRRQAYKPDWAHQSIYNERQCVNVPKHVLCAQPQPHMTCGYHNG